MSQFAGFGKEFGMPAQGVSTKEIQILEVEVEKIVEIEKIVVKPVEKVVEVVKIVEVEKPVIVEKIVVEKVPVETVIRQTIIEPSLKAEEALMKVSAEIARLNKRFDDNNEKRKTNQKFMKTAFFLILLLQILGFFL